jgi:hypothetical protein
MYYKIDMMYCLWHIIVTIYKLILVTTTEIVLTQTKK